MITIDQLKQVEIKVGEIVSAEKIEGADKLLKLLVNFGEKISLGAPVLEVAGEAVSDIPKKEIEKDIRQVISGIALQFPDPLKLVGLKCAFITNLEPRTIRGFQSNGMILAAGGGTEPFTLLYTSSETVPGSTVR